MHFAKLFTVNDNKQLRCVLKASEDDGAPEIQVTTYVAGILRRVCQPIDPTALDAQPEPPNRRRGWLDIPMVSIALH